MTVAAVMAALILLYAGASLYLRKASEYLKASEAVWERLYDDAKMTISDQKMPNAVAGFAAAAVFCAGCGCLTRQLLIDAFQRRFLRKKVNDAPPDDMTAEQKSLYASIVVHAIYYDSLRAPISGFLLRRLVFPWLRAAAEDEAPPRKGKVAQMAAATRQAIKGKPEGEKLLAMV